MFSAASQIADPQSKIKADYKLEFMKVINCKKKASYGVQTDKRMMNQCQRAQPTLKCIF